jgi:hypothetical protein
MNLQSRQMIGTFQSKLKFKEHFRNGKRRYIISSLLRDEGEVYLPRRSKCEKRARNLIVDVTVSLSAC